MVTVKNLTNSPYDLPSTDGMIRLPAFGEVSGEFSGDYLRLLESSMAVRLTKAPPDSGLREHDTDGELPVEMAKLRADYFEIVGKKPYHGWSAEELQEKIDAKLAE